MDFQSHFQYIFRQLNYQRLHAQLCDCVVLVGGQTFQAHRAILAASSSHFRALLSSNDSGDEGGGPSTNKSECGGPTMMALDPEVVTPEAFSTLLDMIYTSTLSLGSSNVMDVLLAASHLHLNAVVKACKLHLSKKNFPSAPPKGWRSVQTFDSSQQKRASMYQQVTSGLEEDSEEDAVVEVSQSEGTEDKIAPSSRHKRKSEDEMLCIKKKPSTGSGEMYRECSPTVSMSLLSAEDTGEDLLSPDSLRLPERLWESPGEEEDEVEEKYEATKGESDEIQLPSQSHSSFVDIWDKVNGNDRDNEVKVKVGEEGAEHEAPMITMVEVKRENMNSPELKPVINDALQCLAQASPNQPSVDKMSTAEVDESILGSHLCTNLNSEVDKGSGDTEDDPVGLDSLSDLAFSCFLNPTTESVIGALEEDSLASLTAAATEAAAASDATIPMDNSSLCQNEDQSNSSSIQSSDSSLAFPVTSVPLQQLLPTQSSGFTDTLILQPAPNPLTGYLSSLGPGLTLEASVIQPSSNVKSRAAGSSGVTSFRRIAPKVPPESEVSSDPSRETAERPSLTRASEDVMSKCKKAAAEDHVLLVEGDKKYACKMCCKTFMNLTDCKKHIRVHTGEKPYPCPKCGKRFSQSSHLYKHTKNSCQNWKDDQAFSDSLPV
ncbi:zinc finger and BTB domain-containing protein 5-like [Periophthalmus magnuspinnatus]|uniref:zinc finger and BTB domain-containing protein 5-like n=1 Tax=Periophthalmus magnuspinnatus TaxID=409849 RepID=UPI00145A33C8|nr:zinc finger and BTB domain-containing protein 5-like [Periophthalmus magnuspinnatus]